MGGVEVVEDGLEVDSLVDVGGGRVVGVVLSILAILETIGYGPTKLLTTIDSTISPDSNIFLSPAGSAIILIAALIPTLAVTLLTAFNKSAPTLK